MRLSGWCWRTVLGFGLLSWLAAPARAADERLTWSAARQPLTEALASLAHLSDHVPQPDYAVATSPTAVAPITCTLRNADQAAVRQALAHAAGLWWSPVPAGTKRDGEVILSRDPHPPRGLLSVSNQPSSRTDATAEATVRTLLGPWLGPGDRFTRGEATVTVDPSSGGWITTLDDGGRAQIIELLALLQQPRPHIPPLLPDPGELAPHTRIDLDLTPGSWQAWIGALATSVNRSISLAPGIDDGATAPELHVHGGPSALNLAWAQAGLANAIVSGVMCLGRTTPDDRLHPALRRRLAVVPVAHLATTDTSGLFLAERLRTAVGSEFWGLPGWDLRWLPEANSVLIAADPATIHLVLDALDHLDRGELRPNLPLAYPRTP